MGDIKESDLRRDAESIFFKAMCAGYAVEGTDHWEREPFGHGYANVIAYDEELWAVRDRWLVGQNGHSAGWTVITYDSNPIWHMQYWGRYEKRAIPLLKAALRSNYEQEIFHGGRGPTQFVDEARFPDMLYANVMRNHERFGFERFSGVEGILAKGEGSELLKHLGFHEYQGGLLI